MRNNQLKKLIMWLSSWPVTSWFLGNFLKIPAPTGFLTDLVGCRDLFYNNYTGRKEAAIVRGLSGFSIDMVGCPSG